jgi:hypothetical protein
MDLSGSWEYIEDVARSRLAHNKTPHHCYQFGPQIEILGVAGELLARRFLGLPEDLHTGFDGGCDLLYRNLRVDVKACRFSRNLTHFFLQFPAAKPVKAQIVFLTAIDMREQSGFPVGFAFAREVRIAPINNQAMVACHEIPVPKLHQPYELNLLLEKRW